MLKMQRSFEAQLARLTDDLVAVRAQQSVCDQMQKEYDEKITKMQAAVTALELVEERLGTLHVDSANREATRDTELATLHAILQDLKSQIATLSAGGSTQWAGGSTQWGRGPPGLGLAIVPAVPPQQAAQLDGALILVKWMPEHSLHRAPQQAYQDGQKPDVQGCEHVKEGWFCMPLDGSESWRGAGDIPPEEDPRWAQHNTLQNMCTSFTQVSEMNWQRTNTMIYDCMAQRPNMLMVWQNKSSACYYLRFACRNCNSCTPKFQPQLEMPWYNQPNVKGDPAIKAAFRHFCSRIFNDTSLEETHGMQ